MFYFYHHTVNAGANRKVVTDKNMTAKLDRETNQYDWSYLNYCSFVFMFNNFKIIANLCTGPGADEFQIAESEYI